MFGLVAFVFAYNYYMIRKYGNALAYSTHCVCTTSDHLLLYKSIH